MVMKIMTYNICHCAHYIHKGMDYPAFANVIKKYSPDIIGLNEVRNLGEWKDYDNQPEILSNLTGIKTGIFAKAIEFSGNPYGNAMLTNEEVLSYDVIPIPDPKVKKYDGYYETRCVLKVKFKNGLTVLVSHFGLNLDEQELAVKTVLDNIVDEKCILMGDFNMTPDNPILKPLLDKLFDTATLASGNKLTFPSDSPNVKIDYVLTSKDVVVESAEIPNVVVSDHRPHVAIVK